MCNQFIHLTSQPNTADAYEYIDIYGCIFLLSQIATQCMYVNTYHLPKVYNNYRVSNVNIHT